MAAPSKDDARRDEIAEALEGSARRFVRAEGMPYEDGLLCAAVTRVLALETEVARLRSRVRVETEDVERAGVTPAKVASWLRENRPRYPTPNADAAPSLLAYIIYDNAPSVAQTWRILDEMARMEVPP